MATTTDEARALGQVTERIRERFPSAPPDEIRTAVERVHHQYDGRPIREFVPVLVEREVTETLHLTLSV
jgi:hypothetical protein